MPTKLKKFPVTYVNAYQSKNQALVNISGFTFWQVDYIPAVLRRTYAEDATRIVDRTTQPQSDTRWQHVLLCESARADRNYPITIHLVAYQKGTHVQCDVQRDPETELEKRSRRVTHDSRSVESCAVIGAAPSVDRETQHANRGISPT